MTHIALCFAGIVALDAKRVVADALDAVSQLRLPEGSHAKAAA